MSSKEKLTKEEQRTIAREKAKAIQQQKASAKARKSIITKILVIAIPVILIAVGLLFAINSNKESTKNMDIVRPTNAVERGVIVGQGDKLLPTVPTTPVGKQTKAPAHVVIYQDYICPGCKAFEDGFASEIDEMINDGSAVVEYRTITFLDNMSGGTNYSSRAANVSYCVAAAVPDKFFAFNALLYKNQPAEMSKGLKNDEMIKLAESLGIERSQIESCVKSGQYRGFIADNNKFALSVPISGTPTILINGVEWNKQGSLIDAVKASGALPKSIQ